MMSLNSLALLCFVFQAEDGIRDRNVTGVQTCALPIFQIGVPMGFEHIAVCGAMIVSTRIVSPLGTIAIAANSFAVTAESLCYMRSEERRVGKECRYGGWAGC